jgi:hypothetical protein
MRTRIAISLLAAGALSLASLAISSKAEAQSVRGGVGVQVGGPVWGAGFRAGPRIAGPRAGFRGARHWGGPRYRHPGWPAAAIAGAAVGVIGAAAAAPYYYDGYYDGYYGPYAYEAYPGYAPAYSYPAYSYPAYSYPAYSYYEYDVPDYGYAYATRAYVYGPRYRTARTVRHYRHPAPVVAYGPTYRTRTVRQRSATRVRPARTQRVVRTGVSRSGYRPAQMRTPSRAVRSGSQVRVRAGTARGEARVRANVRR